MSWPSSVWLAMFESVNRAIDFFGTLAKGKSSKKTDDATDAEAARAGTAAGAAAREASHIVESKKKR